MSVRTATTIRGQKVTLTNKVETAQGTYTLDGTASQSIGVISCAANLAGTLFLGKNSNKIYSSPDGVTWTLMGTGPTNLAYLRLLPNGEMLAAVWTGGTYGELHVSTGWATNPATATWAKVWTTSRMDNRVVEGCVDNAPVGHFREGLVVATEYGQQSVAGDADTTSPKVVLSMDYGKTWTPILSLYSIAGKVNEHMHTVCYDPWDDQVVAAFGDGGTTPITSIMRCKNYTDPVPTWEHLPGFPQHGAYGQAWAVKAFPVGIITTPDGAPYGISVYPRAAGQTLIGRRTLTSRHVQNQIGNTIYRRESDNAGVATAYNPASSTVPAMIWATANGYDWDVIWEATDTTSTGQGSWGTVLLETGKFICYVNSGTTRIITGTLTVS